MTENNHNLEDEHITLVDSEGNEELYEVLLTFESEEFDKSYVLVHPASSSTEEVEVFAFSYEESKGGLEGELGDVETDEEWDMIEEVLGAFVEEDEK
ncbi:MAG: DUF1292 domain-containing protein [Atopostipes suicloacalis]|nr:DUF1292 domain-containing protein [Atopostipes suicloacalis]